MSVILQGRVAKAAPRAVLGMMVASLAFSGVQFGMASDRGNVPGDASLQSAPDASAMVNRLAKSDRGTVVRASVPSATLAFQLLGLKQTTVAMRMPIAGAPQLQTASDAPAAAPPKTNVSREPVTKATKAMIACELVVSPLTEVAKQLGPGRCLT